MLVADKFFHDIKILRKSRQLSLNSEELTLLQNIKTVACFCKMTVVYASPTKVLHQPILIRLHC